MRKIFIGECIVIAALLFVIGALLGTEETKVWGKDLEETDFTQEAVVTEQDSGLVQYAKDIIEGESIGTVLSDSSSVSADQVSGNQVSANQVSGNQEAEQQVADNDLSAAVDPAEDGEIKIAVFGDSIWNADRGAGSIGEQVEAAIGATVYNCAIGGSSAAVISDSTDVSQNWRSRSLNGMMYVARGELTAEGLLEDTSAYEPIKAADFSEVDYLVIAYGLNDYFSGVTIYPQDMYDMTTYVGALRHAVTKMKETFPHMKIILISPTYTEVSTDLSVDSLEMYAEAVKQVSEEYETYFLDMYHDMGIDSTNKEQYLEDGIHLNLEGRKVYAEDVIQLIQNIEAQK